MEETRFLFLDFPPLPIGPTWLKDTPHGVQTLVSGEFCSTLLEVLGLFVQVFLLFFSQGQSWSQNNCHSGRYENRHG